MIGRRFVVSVVLLASTTGTLAGTAQRTHKPATYTVIIDGMKFTPAMVTARPGDTVVWVNNDVVAHTATSAEAGFNSRAISPGKSWKLTVKAQGASDYVCSYHPTMKGSIRVE